MARWLVWAVAAVGVLAALASIPYSVLSQLDLFGDFVIAITLGSIALILVGAVLATRVPRNAIGWIYLASGTIYATVSIGQAYANWAFTVKHSTSMPLEGLAAWWAYWAWITAFTLFAVLGFLLFPDGKPPSKRWLPVVWLSWAAVVMTCLNGIAAWGARPDQLIGQGPDTGPSNVVGTVGVNLFPLLILVSMASLVIRFVRSRGEIRKQIEWFVFAGVTLVVAVFIEQLTGGGGGTILTAIAFPAVPIAAGVAILRYRLWDIDVVVKKTVVVGLTAAFITAIYVAVVAGVGALVGSQGGVLLSAAAAAVVAVVFLPLRQRARRIADRIVYGKRATPYEVLAEFSDRVGDAYEADDVLPRMAQVLAQGTGAETATVWLSSTGGMRPVATWPVDGPTTTPVPLDATEVTHRSETLGALSVTMPTNDPMNPTKQALVSDLASQAGLVLRNVSLIEDLRASRQRLVAAQDEERRKIERNIHDGAQQQLVALAIQLKLAAQMVDRDAERAKSLLDGLQGAAGAALEDLRDLARGIYPPLLADKGLAPALESQARKAALPVTVEASGFGRFAQDVESTVYFCTLEALNNVAKYAQATRATVRLSYNGEGLRFDVQDDGVGFDASSTGYGTGLQGMADRLAALGGSLEVRSTPGRGTTIGGRLAATEVSP